nr:putative disease resistance protein RGA3 isoform X2 [Setaria viridis]
MAAVLDAMVPYVLKLITDMAEEEVSMLLGVSSEITRLEGNMEGIQVFVADAERRRITDKSVQRWVRKLKDAMYDATDIIDLCQLEAADKQRGSTEDGSIVKKKVSTGCFQPLLFCLRNPVSAHEIGSRIKELNQRLDGIHKEAPSLNFIINLGSNQEPRMLTDAERSMQKTTSEFNESAIVGEKIEQDTRELAQLLITSGLHDIKVVSIVGIGGMGKTTLAQKIFNEVTFQEHFKVKVWLSITQHFDEIELLKTAIEHAGGVYGRTQDKTLLTQTLTDTLSTGRFLLVMDDVWSDQAWSHVLSVPIRNASKKQQGNWVLITTRLEDLAQRMGASFYQHHVSPLNEEDAWSLLTKQLPPSPNQGGKLSFDQAQTQTGIV